MKEEITKRLAELLETGESLVARLPKDKYGVQYWVDETNIPEYQAWILSAVNLIQIFAPPDSPYASESQRAVNHKDMASGVPTNQVCKVYGLLQSARTEWERGLLGKIEYLVAAATFDEFLDHAESYHKANKKTEASILASAVLEDTIKKVCNKHSISTEGKTLDPLIDELTKASVFTQVKAKRTRALAGVRNHALHAEWDRFDIKDVAELIKGTRELIDTFL